MKKILYLCTGNSCRSQMAEAWTNYLQKDKFMAYSAGIAPKGVDPKAIKVMAEAGVDISSQRSKDIDSLGAMEFDYVVTLCDNANEACPFFPAKTRLLHRGFDDPPRLSEGISDEDEALRHYRRVRDEIKTFVENIEEELSR
ncbi:MAG: arsenate reductase ArsC [Desulfatiglans sp.]|nr:arsenate reductase ArsC [Desulfatiglans sp.]